jgi:hypothetical protein
MKIRTGLAATRKPPVRRRVLLASLAPLAALGLVAVSPLQALADSTSPSSVVDCAYPGGGSTKVSWRIYYSSSGVRRISAVAFNQNIATGQVISPGYNSASFDSWTVHEDDGPGPGTVTLGTGAGTSGTNWSYGTWSLNTTQMPWRTTSYQMRIVFHIRRASDHSECWYYHAA